jgi:hypothetical protein
MGGWPSLWVLIFLVSMVVWGAIAWFIGEKKNIPVNVSLFTHPRGRVRW